MRHIAGALLLVLGLTLGAQAAEGGGQGGGQAAATAPAKTGGINAVLGQKPQGDDFLPPDEAFRFDALAEGSDRVRLNWEIAEGYYLYRARIKVTTSDGRVELGAVQFPEGQVKNDEYFGRQVVYHHELAASLPVARRGGGAVELPLSVTYQGCADAGLCYPPITKTVTVKLAPGGAGALPGGTASPQGGVHEQSWFADLIRGGSLLFMIGAFYLAGLGLAFTPCVLPMVPILSGIIAGSGDRKSTRLNSSH